jgi:phage FluMu protein Com
MMTAQRGHANDAELRCHCGSLMARVTPRGIELKCRRCKRVVVVAADRARSEWIRVPLHGGGLTAS